MIKQIRISSELTADLFGCDADHFRLHIRGKLVQVVNETLHFFTIEDSNGDEWTVNKSDLERKPAEA